MSTSTRKKKSTLAEGQVCPLFHRAVELIGRRWTGAIVQMLMTGPARFSEIKERVPELSDRLLSERLKELEEAGIVLREVQSERPPVVRYRLTASGRALEPALEAIGEWARDHLH